MLPSAFHYPSLLSHICSYLSAHHALARTCSELCAALLALRAEDICVDPRIQAAQSVGCFEWFHSNRVGGIDVHTMPLPWHIARFAPVDVFDAAVRACARQPKPTVTIDNVAEAIGLEGRLGRLLEFLESSQCICDQSAFCQSAAVGAAAGGRLGFLKRLHRLRHEHPQWMGSTLSPAVMDAAASQGRLQCVQWLHDAGYACTAKAMDDAAINGHLETVIWLHVNREEGCTTDAMDYAAMNGHLHILHWLHEHRFEGCTPAALNCAAAAGHFEVVRWLHVNRREGCADMALQRAAEGGYLEIVEWLYPFMAHVEPDAIAMSYAARNGHLHVVQWLFHHGWEHFADVAAEVAAEYGHVHIGRWLDSVGGGAACTNGSRHYDDVEWALPNTVHVQ